MDPKYSIVIFLALVAAATAVTFPDGLKINDTETNLPVLSAPDEVPNLLCPQVISPAKNQETGEVRDFPTPCDIPDGWLPVNGEMEYVATPDQCPDLEIICAEGYERFDDENGCGCRSI